MTAVQQEADEIIHMMRQSKMDVVREFLEREIRISRSSRVSLFEREESAKTLRSIRKMFQETSRAL